MDSSMEHKPKEDPSLGQKFQCSIESAARQCRGVLQQCMRITPLMNLEWAENRLAEFNLWTAMTGALAGGAASLDSRLATEWEAKNLVIGILILLLACLEKCQRCALMPEEENEGNEEEDEWSESTPNDTDAHQELGAPTDIPRGFSPWSDDSSSDPDFDQDMETSSNGRISLLSEAKAEVEQIVDHLTRVALAIRKAGTSSRLHKADRLFKSQSHQKLRSHLELIVLARGSEEGRKEHVVDSASLTPIQERLILANLRRRNRYEYAQRHARKLAVDASSPDYRDLVSTDVNLSALPDNDPTTQTQDARQTTGVENTKGLGPDKSKTPQQYAVLTATSASGVAQTIEFVPQRAPTPSRVAKTNITTTTVKVLYPKPPRPNGILRYFQCPCCAQTLPELYRENTTWKKHLMADICPYTCILEDCSKPERLYVTRNEWTRHVEREHQQCWQCSPCTVPGKPPLVFPSVGGLIDHLRQAHSDTISENQYSTLVADGARPVPPGISSCPLCDSTGPLDSPELLDHIAEHLHAFSLRSLPWAMEGTQSDGSEDPGGDYFDDGNYFDQGFEDQSHQDNSNDSDRDSNGLASLHASSSHTESSRSAISVTSTRSARLLRHSTLDIPHLQRTESTKQERPSLPRREEKSSVQRTFNLSVTIVAIDDLYKRDFFRSPDPFVILTIDDDPPMKTTTVKKNLNPYWNETFTVSVNPDSILTVQVFDQKKFNKKDRGFLGACKLRIGDVIDVQGDSSDITLHQKLVKMSDKDAAVKGRVIINLSTVMHKRAQTPDYIPEETNSGQTRPSSDLSTFEDAQGRLPADWERREDSFNRTHYIDHTTRTTTWNRPMHGDSTAESRAEAAKDSYSKATFSPIPSADLVALQTGRRSSGWKVRLGQDGTPNVGNDNNESTILGGPFDKSESSNSAWILFGDRR